MAQGFNYYKYTHETGNLLLMLATNWGYVIKPIKRLVLYSALLYNFLIMRLAVQASGFRMVTNISHHVCDVLYEHHHNVF